MPAADPDDHGRTLEIGVRALAQVTQTRTSAEPHAYEVWYEYIVGHHPALTSQLRALLTQGNLSDADVRALHARHLSPMRTSDRIEEIGAGTQGEVRSLLGSVKSTIADLSGMGEDLETTADRLSAPGLAVETVRGLVDTAVATTRKACDTNAGLRARLVESETSIAALNLALETARDDALRDSLTGLYNRRAFDAQLKARFETASASGSPLCLVMLDIDHFKSFNDSHGHPVGDQAIRTVGRYLRESIAAPDLPARYGGEEFAIVAAGRTLSDAMALAEDIRRKVERDGLMPLGARQAGAKLTISAGVASRRPGDSAATLLARADECLYAAKRLGRNRVSADAPTYPEQAEIEESCEAGRSDRLTLSRLPAAGLRRARAWFEAVQRRIWPKPGAIARH